MEKAAKLSGQFHPSSNRDEAPHLKSPFLTHPLLRALTYRAGAVDDGAGAAGSVVLELERSGGFS